jgi:hypothetical protein
MIGSQAEAGSLQGVRRGCELTRPPFQLCHHLDLGAFERTQPTHSIGVHEDPVQAHAIAGKSLQNGAKPMLEM